MNPEAEWHKLEQNSIYLGGEEWGKENYSIPVIDFAKL